MASDVQIQLAVVTSQFTAGLKAAGEKLNAFATQSVKDIEKVSASSSGLDRRIGSMFQAFAGAQILKGLFDIALGADKVSGALAVAANTAHNLNKQFDAGKVKSWMEGFALSKAGGGFALDELAAGMEVLASSGAKAAQAERLTGLAANIAAGRHMEYSQALMIVNKVITGHVGMIGRLGFATKDAAGKTLSAAAAVTMLEHAFKGDAEKRADTLAGALGRLQNNFAILKEQMAVIIEPVITALVSKLNDLINRFRGLSPEMQRVILGSIGMLGALTGLGMFMPILINSVKGVISIVTFFASSTVGLVITALVGLGLWIKYIIDNWHAFYQAQQDVINWMGNAWRSIVRFMLDRFGDLIRGVKGVIELLHGNLQGGLNDIKGAMMSNVAGWEGAGRALGNAVATGVQAGWSKIKGAWARLTSGQNVTPFAFGGVPTDAITGMNAGEDPAGSTKSVKGKPGKAPKTFHGDQYIIWDFKDPKVGKPGNLYGDSRKDYTAQYPVPSVLKAMRDFAPDFQLHIIDPIKQVHEGLKSLAASLGAGFEINQSTGRLFFSWQGMLLQAISQTKAFADIQAFVAKIMGVVAQVLDALRPVIDLVLKGLIFLVNGIISVYNVFARILRALGIHVALLDKINGAMTQAAVPFIQIIHDIPTLNELGSGKIGPLHPAEFYQQMQNANQGIVNAISGGGGVTEFLGKILGAILALKLVSMLGGGGGLLGSIGKLFSGGLFKGIGGAISGIFSHGLGAALGAALPWVAGAAALFGIIKLFGHKDNKQNMPDKYLPGYQEFLKSFNEGGNASGAHIAEQFLGKHDDSGMSPAMKAAADTLRALGRGHGQMLGIASEKDDVFTLASGAHVKVEDYMAVVQTFMAGLHQVGAGVAAFGARLSTAATNVSQSFRAVGNDLSDLMRKSVAVTRDAPDMRHAAPAASIVQNNNFSGPIHGYNDVTELGKDLAESTARALRMRPYALDKH
ncbi:MAG: hypothetical protein ACR2KS_10105 [Candidatus Eremiobacter antarcticus]|nr:hypothetical protein [Candidatus Eremiobacteraeota bacterium]MBC5808786.1 hypothetical protein [Candidatus Eremiobacteraeota bacterium]